MLEDNPTTFSCLTLLHRPAGDCPHQLRSPAGGVFSGAAAATAIRTGRPARRPRHTAAAAAAGQRRQSGVGRRSGSEPAVRLRQQQPRQQRGRFGGEHQMQLRSGAERGAGAPGDRRRACGSRSGGTPLRRPGQTSNTALLIQMALIVIDSRMARTLFVHAIIAASAACWVLASQQSACGAACRCRPGHRHAQCRSSFARAHSPLRRRMRRTRTARRAQPSSRPQAACITGRTWRARHSIRAWGRCRPRWRRRSAQDCAPTTRWAPLLHGLCLQLRWWNVRKLGRRGVLRVCTAQE